MSKLVWDADATRLYETGTRHGVLYPAGTGAAVGTYPAGVAWNGLSKVTEKPTGAESNPIWADDIKYLDLTSREEFEATIEAYMYPPEFEQCDGAATLVAGATVHQQTRKPFGFVYRTVLGNDEEYEDYGYKLHLIYGAKAKPAERAYETINNDPSAITMSWDITTTPVEVPGLKPSAHIEINSKTATAARLAILEAVLFGADEFSATSTYAVGDIVTHETGLYVCSTAITTAGAWSSSSWTEVANVAPGPRLPLPAEVKTILTATTVG